MQNLKMSNIKNLVALVYSEVSEAGVVVEKKVTEIKDNEFRLDLDKGIWSYKEINNIPLGEYSNCFKKAGKIMMIYDKTDEHQRKTARYIQDRYYRIY